MTQTIKATAAPTTLAFARRQCVAAKNVILSYIAEWLICANFSNFTWNMELWRYEKSLFSQQSRLAICDACGDVVGTTFCWAFAPSLFCSHIITQNHSAVFVCGAVCVCARVHACVCTRINFYMIMCARCVCVRFFCFCCVECNSIRFGFFPPFHFSLVVDMAIMAKHIRIIRRKSSQIDGEPNQIF